LGLGHDISGYEALSSSPKSYFGITEEDFQKFPVLKEIMEDLRTSLPVRG